MAFQVPSAQTAAIISNPGPNAEIKIINDAPVDTPGTNSVLVRLEYSGVCGSEVRPFAGWGAYSSVVGHEGIGQVVKLGEDVSESLLGQRVGIKWLFSACGCCSICDRGYHNNCPKQLNTGKHVPGTFQQYVVADARYLTKIPDGLAGEIAAPLLCAGLSMVGAISKLETTLQKGDWVVMSGSGGGLGHLGVQLAHREGYKVIAIDNGQAKRDLSIRSGAEVFLDFKEDDLEAKVKELTGEGAPAIVVVSGAEEAFKQAPALVRNMGLIVCIGLPRNDFDIPIPASLCSARALTVAGVVTGTEKQMEDLLEQALKGQISPEVRVLDFSQLPEVFHQVKRGEVVGRIVVRIP